MTPLSEREKTILRLLARNHSVATVATVLGVGDDRASREMSAAQTHLEALRLAEVDPFTGEAA
uniref:hypothetical protein n=1 Tax=Paractinoplanes polyasparticus TaxID=2856853 RepID=UPI001C850F48|nr:hypothetical protein [Actinoplanes polyasparticus]